MPMRSRGQSSAETMAAIAILLVLAASIGVFAFQRNSEAQGISRMGKERQECERISLIIHSLSASNAKASMAMETENEILISNGLVLVGEHYCEYLGTAQGASLNPGKIAISKNSQGAVVFAQA